VGEDQLVSDEVEGKSRDTLGHVLACLAAGGRAGERLVHDRAAAAGELVDDRVGGIVGREAARRMIVRTSSRRLPVSGIRVVPAGWWWRIAAITSSWRLG
jgi:hypothetical protein